ncbi:MAG: glycosyltransferase family 39 protein [Flavobacteriales bacterium]|nr:glycosyltransferase family 39 protein [Flavobacteriales bacterium]
MAGVLLLAFGARRYAIDRFATGYDELFTVLEANGLYPEVVTEGVAFTKEQLNASDTPSGAVHACISSDGGNGILYILSMHAWTEAFSNSNHTIRLFSLIWGLLVVWLVHRLALRLFTDHSLALLAALFAALAPLLVDYSQEARAYMPATAITLLGTLQFIRLLREPRSSPGAIALYGLLIGTGLLVHYSTAYVAMGHACFALLHVPGRTWRRWFFVAAPVVGALVGAWLLLGGLEGMRNMGRQNDLYATIIATNPDYDVFYRKATVTHLVQDVLVQLLWLGGNSLFLLGPSLRVMALMLLLPFAMLVGLRGTPVNHRSERRLLIILALSGTAFTVLTSAIAGHTFGMRYYYVMFSAPYAIILLAMGGMWWLKQGVRWKRTAGRVLVVMNVCVFLVSILSFYRYGYRGNDEPETVRPFAQVVTALAERVPHARIALIHGDRRDAIALNLHLGPAADRLPQIVDPQSGHRTIVVGSIDGRDRELLTLH